MIDAASYLTPEGHEKLRRELDELVHIKRKEIAARIQEAKELGDLSENAEYQGARGEQAFNEGRIEEVEAILRTAIIIKDEKASQGSVRVGSAVSVEMNGQEKKLHIVGSNEADPGKGFISNVSPLGQALIGTRPGENITFDTPKGQTNVKVLTVE